jgi:tetratricopeptide (TPR) repeat protein
MPYLENLIRKGRIRARAGDYQGAESFFRDALALASGCSDPSLHRIRASAHAELAAAKRWNLRVGQAQHHAGHAEAFARKAGDAQALGRACLVTARLQRMDGAYRAGLAVAESGLNAVCHLHSWRLYGRLQIVLGRHLLALGEAGNASRCAKEALAVGQDASLPEVLSGAYLLKGQMEENLGQFRKARADFRKGWQAAEERFPGLLNGLHLARAHVAQGETGSGELLAEVSAALEERFGALGRSRVLQTRAAVALHTGQLNRAAGLCEAWGDLIAGAGWAEMEIRHRLVRGRIAREKGNGEQAQRYFREAADLAEGSGNPWMKKELQIWGVREN